MFNKTEEEERLWLKQVIEKLEDAYSAVSENVNKTAKELQEQKNYLYENKTGMDAAEKAAVKQTVNMQAISGEAAVAYKKRILKLIETPYFGRIDFMEKGREKEEPIYIGIHSYFDEDENENPIHDWRAPVSSMFYDFEPGQASFEAPSGRKEGEIERKRQYRIKEGYMEMMLESDLYIRDDVLQKELSRSSDEGMKNIVATIQRDQNAIIRDEHASVLIIQGVAGSGKTSIALHRIAFLLYRFKDTLSSEDILIISPNRVFADYISNVLPELGEETVSEVQMETLAAELLEHEYRFQTFFEQTAQLLKKPDEALQERIAVKSSADFLATINAYAAHVEKNSFTAGDLWIGRRLVPGWLLEETFQKHRGHALTERVNRTAAA